MSEPPFSIGTNFYNMKNFIRNLLLRIMFSDSRFGGRRLSFLEQDLVYCDGCGGYFTEPNLVREMGKPDLCPRCFAVYNSKRPEVINGQIIFRDWKQHGS